MALTRSVVHAIDLSTSIMLLRIQAPWMKETGQPPSALSYNLLIPKANFFKCGTYIPEDLNLNRRTTETYEDCI